MKNPLWIALFFLFSCDENKGIEVNNGIYLHDNSSKVWLLDKEMDGDKDYTPLRLEYKQIFVFHQSNKLYIYRLNSLGKQQGAKYDFSFNENQLSFYNDTARFDYFVSKATRQEVILKPVLNGLAKRTLFLVPFPEY
jgi:hypothetical protein